MRRSPKLIVPLLSLLLASLAWAATEAELATRATALESDLSALDADVAACPDGDCPEAQSLLDTLDALDADRAALHDDRDAVPGCECSQVDASLAVSDSLAETLRTTTGTWEEEGA